MWRSARSGLRRICQAGVMALLLAAAPAGAQGVSVALLPAAQNVSLGGGLDLTLEVTQAGSPFNNFEAVISYDPTALTFVEAVPVSAQIGCMMNGTCSTACGNTFHDFTMPSAGQLRMSVGLLCDQQTLTGPGQLYRLHFQGTGSPQVTWVRVTQATFYDAGLFVTPVSRADAQIGLGVTLDVAGGSTLGLRLRAEPNPARGAVTLTVGAEAAGVQQLDVFDALGRRVRRLAGGWHERGLRQLAWDGRDDAGARLPAGLYLITLRAGQRATRTQVTLLQ